MEALRPGPLGPGGSQVEESVGSSCSHGVSDVWVTESLGPVWALTQAGTGWSPSWPIPGVGRGCRWPPRGAGEHPGSPRYLGSQPPGPAAWRVSIWAAGVGEAPGMGVGRTSEAHSPRLAEARTCWSWWPRSELGTGIQSPFLYPACCPVSGPGGRAKRVCGTRAELAGSQPRHRVSVSCCW